ncbi:MAG: endonuclease/exonuclease/phosphatase family protein [Prevotellaceae bacterium]|jgi:endonuclease/exonuclease/phosphatase family metal-dependent hydrolase|nr:endonuclease/exonuclease/phosphatase family protein [Prevotellaceae bacterium]
MKRNLIFTFLAILSCLLAGAQELNVGTYNIRVDKQEDVINGNGWQKRCPRVCELVLHHDFHLFGAQEVEYHQLKDMQALLRDYSHIGVAREDGNEGGEFVPIFYRRDMLELLDSGNFWLSETPEKPSKGWDAECYRICTWGKFKTREGVVFYHFNTHLDHRGARARERSARLITAKIAEIAGEANVILTGDFNVGEITDVYRIFKESDILDDSYDMASHRLAWMGTANNFDPGIMTVNRLDYIFLSPAAKVKRYGVLTDSYRDMVGEEDIRLPNFPEEIVFRKCVVRFPSDHYPVMVEITFGTNAR